MTLDTIRGRRHAAELLRLLAATALEIASDLERGLDPVSSQTEELHEDVEAVRQALDEINVSQRRPVRLAQDTSPANAPVVGVRGVR